MRLRLTAILTTLTIRALQQLSLHEAVAPVRKQRDCRQISLGFFDWGAMAVLWPWGAIMNAGQRQCGYQRWPGQPWNLLARGAAASLDEASNRKPPGTGAGQSASPCSCHTWLSLAFSVVKLKLSAARDSKSWLAVGHWTAEVNSTMANPIRIMGVID